MGLKLKELEHLWVMNEFKLPENIDFSLTILHLKYMKVECHGHYFVCFSI